MGSSSVKSIVASSTGPPDSSIVGGSDLRRVVVRPLQPIQRPCCRSIRVLTALNESSNRRCAFLFGCQLGGGRNPIGNHHKACHCHSILLARSLLVNLSIFRVSNRSHDIVERATISCYTSQESTLSGTIDAPEAVLIHILRDGCPCINLPSIGARHAG